MQHNPANMTKALARDLKKLQSRSYHRAEWAEEVLQHYHAIVPRLEAGASHLHMLYEWMFGPPTLWPFNIQDLLSGCLAALENGTRLNDRERLLIAVAA